MNPFFLFARGHRAAALSVLLCLLFAGCATTSKPLYYWGDYQAEIYDHFKADGKGPQEQIAAMEQDLQKMSAKDMLPPPGFHAHLGLLYIETGQTDSAQKEFQTEKTLFPESAPYMDRLLSKFQK